MICSEKIIGINFYFLIYFPHSQGRKTPCIYISMCLLAVGSAIQILFNQTSLYHYEVGNGSLLRGNGKWEEKNVIKYRKFQCGVEGWEFAHNTGFMTLLV